MNAPRGPRGPRAPDSPARPRPPERGAPQRPPERGAPQPQVQRAPERTAQQQRQRALERRAPSAPPPPRRASVPPGPAAPEASRPRTRLFLAPTGDGGDEAVFGPAFPEYAFSDRAHLVNLLHVRRAEGERPVVCEAGDLTLRRGDRVAIETDRGVELVVVVDPPRRQWVESRPGLRALRVAGEAELQAETRTRLRAAEAVRVARETVDALGAPVKVVRAEVALSGGRITVYLASEERVDLRELARRLSSALRTRIDLRHLGMRDAARVTGGVGPCGLQLCCNTFLAEFAPVSIRMAKDQGLALNPQRVSGVCGRLMCCLVYEDAFYRSQRGLFPKQGKAVVTPRGPGRVRDVDVLARKVRVTFADGGLETFDVEQVQPAVHTGANGGGAAALPAEDTASSDEDLSDDGPRRGGDR